MGLTAASISDEPEDIYDTIASLLGRLPALVNIKTCRHLWHAGVGTDGPPAWDRLKEFRPTVPGADAIETDVQETVIKLWQEQLQIP